MGKHLCRILFYFKLIKKRLLESCTWRERFDQNVISLALVDQIIFCPWMNLVQQKRKRRSIRNKGRGNPKRIKRSQILLSSFSLFSPPSFLFFFLLFPLLFLFSHVTDQKLSSILFRISAVMSPFFVVFGPFQGICQCSHFRC